MKKGVKNNKTLFCFKFEWFEFRCIQDDDEQPIMKSSNKVSIKLNSRTQHVNNKTVTQVTPIKEWLLR